jgi:dienelactone hydrolase
MTLPNATAGTVVALMNVNDSPPSQHAFRRRLAFATLAIAVAATAAFPQPSTSPTPAVQKGPQNLEPTQSDLGSLFPQVQKLAESRHYEWSFLNGRFKSFKEFQTAGREKVLEVLSYRRYVVITIDAFNFGERRVILDGDLKYGLDRSKYTLDDVKHLNGQCRGKEVTLVKALTLAGTTWPGIVAWDDMRTVDYLLTRPEVDPKRIGCIGISMGGYRALYLSALDERIRAGCVVGFMSSVRPIHAHLDTHSWVHFLPALHQYLDLPDVASLTAPRSLLVQQCSQDRLFPPAGMKESVEKIARVYEKAGAQGKFDGRFYDVPHRFTLAMQDDAFAWLDRQLEHRPGK